MAAHEIDTVLGWRDREVVDPSGERIGKLGDVYLDRQTDQPAWAGVRTGLFGARETLIPLEGMQEEGDALRVPWEKDLIKDAPNVDADVSLDEEGERRLYEHYGRGGLEVVRSEEEPVVTDKVERREERVRLKKVKVTDYVEQQVPVRKEVVEVVEDPPAER
jgi:sporulation protein YlmC with PRC-barrel domain